MKKRLGNVVALLAGLALVLVLSGCDLLGGGTEDASIEGTVWKGTSQSETMYGSTLTTDFPITETDDFDEDGTDETVEVSFYFYLDDSTHTAYSFYESVVIEDSGSVTGTLEGTEYETTEYTLSGTTLSMDGDPYTISVSGDSASMTASIPDTYDFDDDGNTTEEWLSVSVSLTAVSSPSFEDLMDGAVAAGGFVEE